MTQDGKQLVLQGAKKTGEGVPSERFGLYINGKLAFVTDTLSARTLITNAVQPAPSPNGEWLAYVAIDTHNPMSLTRSIRARNLKTSEDRVLIKPDQFFDVYGPRWLNDSQIIFSAADPSLASKRDSDGVPMRMLDALLGLQIAAAHNWSGAVWRVNLDGSGLIQLNQDKLQAPIAAPAPDGKHIAVLSYDGLFVMNSDGSHWTQISEDGGNGGLVWTK